MNISKIFVFLFLLSSGSFAIAMEREIISVKQYKMASHFNLLKPDYDRRKIVVKKTISGPSRHIAFITDGENNKYVIKQKKKAGMRKQLQAVWEKLSAHMAHTLKIPAHRVEVLSAGMEFPGKPVKGNAASILTFVPGIPAKKLSGKYGNIDIRQSNRTDWPKEKLGLHRKAIASIALHPDLALIAALDTFIGNKGRHEANYFYDSKTDRFYAIDMDKIYNGNNGRKELVSKLACDQIRSILHANKSLKSTEFEGLRLYKDTLQNLVDLFPPQRIYELMDEFAATAGFDRKAYLPDVVHKVEEVKAAVKKSHQHVLELIDLLSKLIG